MAESKPDGGGDTPGPQAGRRAWLAGWPRGTRLGVLCLALMVAFGLLGGPPPWVAAEVLAFYVLWVLLPGLGCAALLVREQDEASAVGMGLLVGTFLLGLAVFACRATGAFGALYAWPLVTLVPVWLLRRRAAACTVAPAAGTGTGTGAGATAAAPRAGHWLFLAVLAFVLVRVPTGLTAEVEGWHLMWKDLVFHGGNAAEMLNSGPLLDPRTAGRPLNYHLLSHTLAAAASSVTGESIAELFRLWFLGFHPLVLALLVFGLVRELSASTRAALVSVLVLALHHDLGVGLFGEQAETVFEFNSRLDLGLFVSPSTAFGLAQLAGVGLTLRRCTGPARRPGAGPWLQLALLSMAASMTKGSVMPVAIAGAFFAWAIESLRARRIERTWLAAALVLLVASLPATLYLSLGPGSYAESMFRFAPWASAFTSEMGAHLVELAPWLDGAHPFLGGLLLTIPWLVGFLGLGGVGALAWLLAGRPSLGGLGAWILGSSLAGLGAGTLLLSVGSSQLFFAYNSQMLLALPAGVGALALWRARRGRAVVLLVLALPFLAGGVAGTLRGLAERIEVARSGPALWPKWCEGAAWLRANTPRDALLVAQDDGLLLTQFAERRVALVDAPYTPEEHAKRWRIENGQWRVGSASEDPWLLHKRASESVLRRGDAASIARLLLTTGHRGELYLVRSNADMPKAIKELALAPLPKKSPLDSSSVLEVVFRNEAIAIYRIKE